MQQSIPADILAVFRSEADALVRCDQAVFTVEGLAEDLALARAELQAGRIEETLDVIGAAHRAALRFLGANRPAAPAKGRVQ